MMNLLRWVCLRRGCLATLENFPEAYLLVNASLFCLALPANFFLRKLLKKERKGVTKSHEADD